MTVPNQLSRRETLVATAVSLAGCGSIPNTEQKARGSVSSVRLPDVTQDGEPAQVIVDGLPLRIETRYLKAGAERTVELLDRLPIPLSATDIPNGYIRHELTEAAADAASAVESARGAKSRLSALESLRQARSEAGYAATGWAVADEGRELDAVRTAWQEVRTDADRFWAEHEYVGEDPVRAVLVHAQIERRLDRVRNRSGHPRSEGGPNSLLAIAAWGERTEWARADVDDTRYFDRRLRDSLPDESEDLEEMLRAVAQDIFGELRKRRASLPTDSTGQDREMDWRLRDGLLSEAKRQPLRVSETPGPASAVIDAIDGLTVLKAYDRLGDRIESEEQFRVETIEDVREARSTAVAALETALDDSPRPELARPVLADVARTVVAADHEIGHYSGDVQFDQLDSTVRRYTIATVKARSVPKSTQRVLEALGE